MKFSKPLVGDDEGRRCENFQGQDTYRRKLVTVGIALLVNQLHRPNQYLLQHSTSSKA